MIYMDIGHLYVHKIIDTDTPKLRKLSAAFLEESSDCVPFFALWMVDGYLYRGIEYCKNGPTATVFLCPLPSQ